MKSGTFTVEYSGNSLNLKLLIISGVEMESINYSQIRIVNGMYFCVLVCVPIDLREQVRG